MHGNHWVSNMPRCRVAYLKCLVSSGDDRRREEGKETGEEIKEDVESFPGALVGSSRKAETGTPLYFISRKGE